MLNRARRAENNKFSKAIDKLLDELETFGPETTEFSRTLMSLEKLVDLRKNKTQRFSYDTLLIVSGNLAGILVIVAYESRHVMASKGMNLLLKTR